MKRNPTHLVRRARLQAVSRSGSTLLIVVALMGVLAFLGFVFYTLAVQERTNALSFSEDAKVTKAPSLEPDALFDFVLQQMIFGPDDSNYQSILWGGRHSLLANMFGRDGVPFNGEGVKLGQTAAGVPFVDMNHDGSSAGENTNLLNVVDSPVGNSGTRWGSNTIYLSGVRNPATNLPDPDVNYTYPDINSLFISYDGNAVNSSGTTSSRVVIPTYFRPQYLRGLPMGEYWYSSSTTANKVMRPHPDHACVNSTGAAITDSGGTTIKRFISIDEMDSSITPARPRYQSLGMRRPFNSSTGTSKFAPLKADGSASTGKLGIWSGAAANEIELDVDTDGDGVPDAILMDLGYPPVRRGDGKLVVPLFAVSVHDLNGLLNVNATGNLSGNLNLGTISATNQLGFRQAGPGTYIADSLSKSNQGLSTYEINLQRALTASPSDSSIANSEVGQQLTNYLKLFDPTATQPGRSISELANLEWLILNIGRANFHSGLASSSPIQNAITEIFPGRSGETSRLRNFLSTLSLTDMPRPGQSVASFTPPTWAPAGADDNGNYNEGESNSATRWVHPLDFLGSGQQFQRYLYGADGKPGVALVDDDGNGVVDDLSEEGWTGSDDGTVVYGKRPELYQQDALYWPMYSGYHSFNGSGAGGIRWGETASTGTFSAKLMMNSRWYSLLDDPTEAIIDPTLMSSRYSGKSSISSTLTNDGVFGPDETAFLQGSETDARMTSTPSRLAELMPANLVASTDAASIRKRLTSVSSDRREFGFGTGAVGYKTGTGVDRSWETSPQFPPTLAAGAGNPYRQQLFNLLNQNATGSSQWRAKLNVNRWLTTFGVQTGFASLPTQGNPPAPVDPTTWTANPITATERQELARDIYTLLYTFCLGQDADYRTTTPLGLPPQSKGKGKGKGRKKPVAKVSVGQAQEMAQFAVNLVDELDPDDVPTAFYYDADLRSSTGGWVAADATNVVYGVERQQLVISEALAIRVSRKADDSPMTIFDDSTTNNADGRRYIYCELQNVTPMDVTLATSTSNAKTSANWRVTVEGVNGGNLEYLNSVYLLSGLNNADNQVVIDSSGNRVLPAGEVFTIGSQDGTDQFPSGTNRRTSDFRANREAAPTSSGPFKRVVPFGGPVEATPPSDSTDETMFPKPACNLDLVWNYGAGPAKFELHLNNGTSGAFASDIDATYSTIQLALERRATDGNWIEVDRTGDISVQSIDPPTSPPAVTGALVDTELDKIKSQARTAPLNRETEAVPTSPAAHIWNTLNDVSASSSQKTWQWHNDRDFGSLGELLQIPLYGPDDLTNGRLVTSEFVEGQDSSGNSIYLPSIAAGRFLRPDLTDEPHTSGNRWYRLFEFVEVPNRSHRHSTIITQSALATAPNFKSEPYGLPANFGWPRAHGLINLNMIRHPQVLAALLDDDQLISGGDPKLTGLDESARLWWIEFLKARDSRLSGGSYNADPITGVFVPGTANARPFHGYDAVAKAASSATDSPLEQTLFRALPLDAAALGTNPNAYRRLFEVGLNGTEHYGTVAGEATAATPPLDSSARYRLLSKIMNNVTTRSNSFGVFVTVQYYEAAEQYLPGQSAPAVRIGGRLDDTPTHRGFFVIDRTGAVEQMKALPSNPVSTSTFSFRPDTSTTTTPNGIRWKDLVLYRKMLN